MKNYVQEGDSLALTPSAAVAAGVGYLFGTSLFGVAQNDVAANATGEFITEGVVDIAKDPTVALAVGDRVYWDAANKRVYKTTTGNQCVGIAVAAALAADTVGRIKLGCFTAIAA